MAKQHSNLERSALGRNQSRSRPEKYKHIRKELKINNKFCPGYPLADYIDKWVKDSGSKYLGLKRQDFPLDTSDLEYYDFEFKLITKVGSESIPHTSENPSDIENFSLLKKGKDGLQAKCTECERKWRRVRIAQCKKRNGIAYERNGIQGIYNLYKKRYNMNTKMCSKESGITGKKVYKNIELFNKSITIESGLHNSCASCQSGSSDATSNRWAIYNPDGKGSKDILKTNKSCAMKDKNSDKCALRKKSLHIDHIIPLQKGGSDHIGNHMVLCDTHNLSKQAKIMIEDIKKIKQNMICERYRSILDNAKVCNWSVKKFEDTIAKAVQEFILFKHKMSDSDLKLFFKEEKRKWNRKHGIDYSVLKFRKYCNKRKNI